MPRKPSKNELVGKFLIELNLKGNPATNLSLYFGSSDSKPPEELDVKSFRTQYDALVEKCTSYDDGNCKQYGTNCSLEKCEIINALFKDLEGRGLTEQTADALIYGDPTKLKK